MHHFLARRLELSERRRQRRCATWRGAVRAAECLEREVHRVDRRQILKNYRWREWSQRVALDSDGKGRHLAWDDFGEIPTERSIRARKVVDVLELVDLRREHAELL